MKKATPAALAVLVLVLAWAAVIVADLQGKDVDQLTGLLAFVTVIALVGVPILVILLRPEKERMTRSFNPGKRP